MYKSLYFLSFIILLITIIFLFFKFKVAKSNVIKQLPPFMETNITKILESRRSVREITTEPLSLEEVSTILWSAQGITDKNNGLRTTPSAGAIYPLEIYLVSGQITGLEIGVYKYNPWKNELKKISDKDKRKELSISCFNQNWIDNAPVIIEICAIYDKSIKKYATRGTQYVHMEAGAAAQNIQLQATALKLSSVTVGAFEEKGIQKLLYNQEHEMPLIIIPIGKPVNKIN